MNTTFFLLIGYYLFFIVNLLIWMVILLRTGQSSNFFCINHALWNVWIRQILNLFDNLWEYFLLYFFNKTIVFCFKLFSTITFDRLELDKLNFLNFFILLIRWGYLIGLRPIYGFARLSLIYLDIFEVLFLLYD